MLKLATAAAMLLLAAAPARAAPGADPNAPDCQASVFRMLQGMTITKGQFEILRKGPRCLLFLQVNSQMFPGKRAAWLFEGETGTLLAEFYAPIRPGRAWLDTDTGNCSFQGGRFKTRTCTWADWQADADQM